MTEVGTAGRLRAAVWLPVALVMAGCARPACGRGPRGGAGWRRLPGAVSASARPGDDACALAPVYARTQLRMRLSTRARSSVLWNRQSASSLPLAFGAPGGAVVGARRDAWRSDGVLRDGSYEEYRFCTEAKS